MEKQQEIEAIDLIIDPIVEKAKELIRKISMTPSNPDETYQYCSTEELIVIIEYKRGDIFVACMVSAQKPQGNKGIGWEKMAVVMSPGEEKIRMNSKGHVKFQNPDPKQKYTFELVKNIA